PASPKSAKLAPRCVANASKSMTCGGSCLTPAVLVLFIFPPLYLPDLSPDVRSLGLHLAYLIVQHALQQAQRLSVTAHSCAAPGSQAPSNFGTALGHRNPARTGSHRPDERQRTSLW